VKQSIVGQSKLQPGLSPRGNATRGGEQAQDSISFGLECSSPANWDGAEAGDAGCLHRRGAVYHQLLGDLAVACGHQQDLPRRKIAITRAFGDELLRQNQCARWQYCRHDPQTFYRKSPRRRLKSERAAIGGSCEQAYLFKPSIVEAGI